MNPNLIIVFAFLIAISLTQSASSENFFIVQISPVIDGKAARPSNLTISRNLTSSLSHTLSVSSTNFLKNVTIGLQLFSWYNGDWISKKSRTLQITDRRRIYSSLQKNLLTFMKYADLNAITSKEPVVLNQTSIYISYDPQGSLMTSQLQQPNLFIPNDNYLPVKDINKSIQRINTTLQFRVIHKTDDFILNKRALSELAEIQSRCSEVFPIIATPLNKDVVEPNQIMEIMRKNLQTLAGQEKKVGEKLQLIARYGYKPLLTKDIYKLDILQDYLPIHDYLAKFKLTFKDTLGPIWQWIFNQPFVLAEVQTLQTSFLHEPESLVHNNILQQLSQAAALEQNIDWTVFGIWILLDLASYCFYSFSLGISSSNGTFLNILLISQLVAISLRIGLASIWYLGLIIFFSGLLLHLVVCFLVQRRVNKVQHARSKSDAMLTSIIKNCLILAVFVNISMHLFGGSTITSNRIWNEGFQVLNRLQASPILSILWSFSQFCALLSQYYYVLVLIPQIVLNFRLKNVQKTTLLRILLVGGLCYGEYGLRSLYTEPIYLVFRFKEGILAVILLLQWLAFHKNKVQALPAQIQQQVKVQQGLKSSDSSESMQQQKQ